MDNLQILETPEYDESIESYQYYDYSPQSQQNLDISGPIKIDVNANDAYLQPSKSYLIIKGQLVQDDNTAYAVNAEIALVNNAMMFLFSEVQYLLGGMVVERITNPGQITSLLGYLSQPDDYSTSAGLKSCWSRDTTNNANSNEFELIPAGPIQAGGLRPVKNPNYNQGFAIRKTLLMSANPRGSFSFIIPFEHIFGFAEYDKVIYNIKHSLILNRNSDNILPIHRAQNVANGKIKLNNITWRIPYVKPETANLMKLRDIVINKNTIPLSFSARQSDSTNVSEGVRKFDYKLSLSSGIEKPRWVIVGFQVNKETTQEQNPAVFDNVNLSHVYITLNGERYPINDFDIDFASNDYTVLYEMFDNFKKEYYGFNSLIGGTQVNFSTFKTLFPIVVLDVRRQNERLRSGVVDMILRFDFKEPIPRHTSIFVCTVSDREYKLKSDGSNLTLVSN